MRIAAITGSRADQSPLSGVIKHLGDDVMHIQTQGLLGNEWVLYSKLQLQNCKPDMVLLLGDRYETLAAASVAALLGIPIAHIHGGEVTEGAVDDGFRNAITKLSYWHFTAHTSYAKRIIQMGECPNRVFVTGAPGVDNLCVPKMSRKEMQKELGFKLGKKFALVCFHPETLGKVDLPLDLMAKHHLVICGPNSDPGAPGVRLVIEQALGGLNNAHFKETFGTKLWINLMREAEVLIGNSSSFIFEGMTMGKKIINIGDRQKGRYESAVELFAKEKYPFGKPGTVSKRIADILLSLEIPKIPRKQFYDIIAD